MTSDDIPGVGRRALLAGAAIALAIGAAPLAWWGGWLAPRDAEVVKWVPKSPVAQAPHAVGGGQVDAMVQSLAKRLEAKPDDAEGWAMLARSYAALGRHAEAVPAYARAVALQPGDPALLADYADALALQQGRSLSGEPMKWIERALAIDPKQPKALLLAGTEAFERGDSGEAIREWTQVLEVAPPSSGLAQQAHAGLIQARATR